ncbi:MAG: SCO family protein [Dehalococcoidia bacterium]
MSLPHFDLVDQNNNEINDNSFGDKAILVTFMYTDCKTECPSALNDILSIRNTITENEDRFHVVIFSIDPNENYIDVKNTLSKYQLELDSITYAVGEKADLKPIWDYFYVPVGNVETKRSDLTWILHSIPAYLVLPNKNTTLIYTEFNIDSILTDLNNVLN